MAQGTSPDKGELFIRRAKHLNLAFIISLTILFLADLGLYRFFSLPVSPRLLLYIYSIEIAVAVATYLSAFLIRRFLLPVSMKEDLWSYRAVRRYFWSYVLLSAPFGTAFIFYLFTGNLSSLILGYVLSLCGLILFRPRREDLV